MKAPRRKKTKATWIAAKIRTYALTYEAGGQKEHAEGMRHAADIVDELAQRPGDVLAVDEIFASPSSLMPAPSAAAAPDLEARVAALEAIVFIGGPKPVRNGQLPKILAGAGVLDADSTLGSPIRARPSLAAPPTPKTEGILSQSGEDRMPAEATLHKPLNACERAVLAVLSERTDPASRLHVAIVSGYSVKSSHLDRALARLRAAGWIDSAASGLQIGLRVTPAGRELARGLGVEAPLPRGPALLELWSARLNACGQVVLQQIVSAYPKPIGRTTLSERTGYQAKSSHLDRAIAKLRALQLIERRGPIRASDSFMTAIASPPLAERPTP